MLRSLLKFKVIFWGLVILVAGIAAWVHAVTTPGGASCCFR